LRVTDDQALKELDWKPAVGKYLVRAKYAVLRWIEDDEAPKDLPALGREIQKLASETDVRHLPDYTPVSPRALIDAMQGFQSVKDHLVEGDAASVITPDGELDMNLSMRWDIESLEELSVKDRVSYNVPSMVLMVKKPDYLGTSMWDLRHGRRSLSAKIEDDDWLKKFQGRQVDVRPGDAIRCQIKIEMQYGYDNELIGEKYVVEKVHEVLENQYIQSQLFSDEE